MMSGQRPETARATARFSDQWRMIAIGQTKVTPLSLMMYGFDAWLDIQLGIPLWWDVNNRPPGLPEEKESPSVWQHQAGKLTVEVSSYPGAMLEAMTLAGWNAPVLVVSTMTKEITDVLRFSGQVAMTSHIPKLPPRIVEQQLIDAETGEQLTAKISDSGVASTKRPAVGYAIVQYWAVITTLEVEFGIDNAPWSTEMRERVLKELVLSNRMTDPPSLLLRVVATDPETGKSQSEIVQDRLDAVLGQIIFGVTLAKLTEDDSEDDSEDSQQQGDVYNEVSRSTTPVRVYSSQDSSVWVNLNVANQIVFKKEGSEKTMTLNLEVQT